MERFSTERGSAKGAEKVGGRAGGCRCREARAPSPENGYVISFQLAKPNLGSTFNVHLGGGSLTGGSIYLHSRFMWVVQHICYLVLERTELARLGRMPRCIALKYHPPWLNEPKYWMLLNSGCLDEGPKILPLSISYCLFCAFSVCCCCCCCGLRDGESLLVYTVVPRYLHDLLFHFYDRNGPTFKSSDSNHHCGP